MKKLLFIGAFVLSLVVSSCQSADITTLNVVGEAKENNMIEFIVTSSEPKATYMCGLLTQEVVDMIGGAEGLTSFVNTQLANSSSIELHTGPYSFSFEATPLEFYYYYAAQVDKNKLVGTPVMSNAVRIELPYKRLIPDVPMVGFSISDNGNLVVGNADNKSFIYNRTTDDFKVIEGANLFDISDNGTAVGEIMEAEKPVKYEDENLITLDLGTEKASLRSITPDGNKIFGHIYLENNTDLPFANVPVVIDNGVLTQLSMEGYIFDDSKAITGSPVQGVCGSNGAVSGYILDEKYYFECGSVWLPNGDLRIIGAKHCKYVPEIMFYDYMYGDMFTRISPNGKWVAGIAQKFEGGDGYTVMEYLPFLYNVETEELFKGDESDFNMADISVTAVSNDGLVFISDVNMGLSSNPPLVWSAGRSVEVLQYYLEDTYNVTFEQEMIGSVHSVSDDGRTIIISGYTEEGGGIYTDIYSF